jgi:hypothetical protein
LSIAVGAISEITMAEVYELFGSSWDDDDDGEWKVVSRFVAANQTQVFQCDLDTDDGSRCERNVRVYDPEGNVASVFCSSHGGPANAGPGDDVLTADAT